MSIETEITRLNNAKNAIKSSIESKGVAVPSNSKLDEYPALINNIESGGKALWCGGENPVLLRSEERVYNLANDTNYNSIIPSTSSQQILDSPTLFTIDNLNLVNYDYIVILKQSVKLAYNNIPSNLKYIKSKEYLDIWNSGKVYYINANDKSNFTYSLIDIDVTLRNNGSSGDALQTGYNPYGIYSSSNTQPWVINQTGDVSSLRVTGSPFSCVANASYMEVGAFDYLDAENSSITYKAELYRVDKGTAPYLIARNEAIDRLKEA